MKQTFPLRVILACTAAALGSLSAEGQEAVVLKQVALDRWNIGTANYSGLAPMGHNRYAVVSDKEPADGFFIMEILQDSLTGEVSSARLESFRGNPSPALDRQGYSVRDCEGICYVPESGTLFISGEGDQKILEYTPEGLPTGRELKVPALFARPAIVPNFGFESLSYDAVRRRYWTTTETTLPADGFAAGAQYPEARNVLRIQCFDADLRPTAQYPYRMEPLQTRKFGRLYAYGVSELCALPDGRLLVMEREINITGNYLGSVCHCRIFAFRPDESHQIDDTTSLQALDPNFFPVKTLVASFSTHLRLTAPNLANYEGMCLGRKLADGRQTLLLIADSQGGSGRGPIHLRDWVKVLVLPD